MVSNSLTDRLLRSRRLVRLPRFAMLIVCPNCATSYQVEPPSLGPGGRSVRCSRCRNIWFAAVPTVVPALATVDDFDIVDNGPRIPAVDAPAPAEARPAALEAEASPPEPEDPQRESETVPEWQQAGALQEETLDSVASPEAAVPEAAAEEFQAASIDGIDIERLSADIEVEHAEQAAAADAVLAEVAAGEITVADAPSLVPPMEPIAVPKHRPVIAGSTSGGGFEAFAVRRAPREALRRQRRPWPVPGLSAIILALVAANTILVAWRMDIVRLLPQTASLYAAVGIPVNLRGLSFEDIKMSKEKQDGMTVLVIEGSIVNVTARAVEVPRLRLAVRNESKNEIYAWTTLPTRSILGPGETLPFRSRLASPPAESRDVLVRFFTRRDIVAGLR